MKKYISLSLALLLSARLIAMDEPAASDIIPARKSEISLLSTEKETEDQLMKLMKNADYMYDALVTATPVILPWLRKPTNSFKDLPLVDATAQLRFGTNIQDCLLRNHELEKIYTTTQAFIRLNNIISLFKNAKSESKEDQAFFQQFYLIQPEHSVNDFMRIFDPLQERISNLVEKNNNTNKITSNQKGS